MVEMAGAVARGRAGLGKCLLLLLSASLGACASFDAHPAPVLNISNVTNNTGINVQDALTNFYSTDPDDRDDLTPEGYRNMIVGTYLMAADLRFNEFRRHLSRQSRGSNFGFDLGILGFAGGASIATSERAANVLSALAAGLTGTRSALNRDVFFDRTLPALFAAMDGARTVIRTSIMVNMRRSAAEYPLSVAFADLANYENAGSLDSAIERITGDAVDRADEAQAQYAEAVENYTGPPEVGVPEMQGRIQIRVNELARAGDATTLRTMARQAEITVSDDADANAIARLIRARMRDTRDVAGTRELARKLGIDVGG